MLNIHISPNNPILMDLDGVAIGYFEQMSIDSYGVVTIFFPRLNCDGLDEVKECLTKQAKLLRDQGIRVIEPGVSTPTTEPG